MQFEEKKKALFDCLNAAERALQGSTAVLSQREEIHLNEQRRKKIKIDEQIKLQKYKRSESLFKMPAVPINKCLRSRQKPDHEVITFNLNMLNKKLKYKLKSFRNVHKSM